MLWLLSLVAGVTAVDLCAPLLKAASYEEALVKLETTEMQEPTLSTKCADKEIDFAESVKQRAVDTKKKIEKVLQALDNNGAKIQTLSPAFQWAQSPDKMFLDVKFSHRFDSPGCMELADQYVNITETHVKLGAMCTYSSHRMKYQLEIELFAPIETELSSYSFASKGRCSLSLYKAEKAAWTLPMKGKKPPNMQIWWEMKERHQKAMNRLTGDKEDDEVKDKSGLGDLVNNPNVVIKDSVVNGKKFDNAKEREHEKRDIEMEEREDKERQARKEAKEKAVKDKAERENTAKEEEAK